METVSTCIPRWATARDESLPTDGHKLAKVANLMGFELFDWQRRVADTALERKEGHYVFRTVGASVGRQGGKSKLIEVRIAFELMQGRKQIAYTAQDRAMAKLKWLEHIQTFERTPQIARQIHKVSYVNGSERLIMKNGSSYGIITPNDRGARGLSLNLMVIDEALTHPLSLLASLQPTLATRRDGQLWIVSNAGIPGQSTLLEHYRNIAHTQISNRSTQLAWFEWSPQDEKFDFMDESVWFQAIPTLGQTNGVLLDAVREAAHSSSPDIFTKEWLNVWPATDSVQVIPTEVWDGLARTDITVGNEVVLGVDMSIHRDKSSIAVSGLVGDMTPIEIVEAKDGVNWVVDRVIEIATKWHAPVVIDQGAPASTLIAPLEKAGVKVISLSLRDYARACGSFYDAVQARTICHLDDPNLRQAIIGSSRRALGDSWAWRRHDTNNITPLVAATLARYGLLNQPEELPVQRSKIF